MDYGKFDSVIKKLKSELSPKRYQHSVGVMYTAASLAMAHGENIEKAMLCGLLHDCAKDKSIEEMVSLCDEHGFYITDMERKNKNLLHAKAGAVYAKWEYHIEEESILSAIGYHCTGKPEMSRLDKIIYIADFIEPGRTEAKNLDIIRKKAFADLDDCIGQITFDILNYLNEKNYEIDPITIDTYEYYKAFRKESTTNGND